MQSPSPSIPLGEVARSVGGRLVGDPTILIRGVGPINEAASDQITFVANPKYAKALLTTRAAAVLLKDPAEGVRPAQVVVQDPYYAFSQLLTLFHPYRRPAPGIHPSASIGPGVRLGSEVYIGPFVSLGEGASVGDRAVVHHGVYVGERSEVGEGSLLYPNVVVREGVTIGKRVIVHSGTVIGSDGFGFATHEGRHHKIPQVGRVLIEDDVEIGSNVSVDRAALGVTRIGRGTKIDNLVQIAHNVVIGENCLIVAQAGISGSTELGNHVVLGGQVGIVGHVKIGERVMVAAQSGISGDVPAGSVVFGSPAFAHREALKSYAVLPYLPKMKRELQRLAKQVSVMMQKLGIKSDDGDPGV